MTTGIAEAFGFLTIGPGGTSRPNDRALLWFGAVGVAVGSVVAVGFEVADRATSVLAAAVIAVVIDVTLTGALHVDGLADSADGLLPPVDRSRRLAIMATPDVGAFGVVAIVLCMLLRVAGFAAAPSVVLVAALWAVSRSLAAIVVVVEPYARGTGLAGAFVPDGRSRSLVLAANGVVVLAAAAVAAAVDGRGGLGVVAAVVTALGVTAFSRRRMGGFTGDSLGALILLSETIGLLVATSG